MNVFRSTLLSYPDADISVASFSPFPGFPPPTEANNRNAYDLALTLYKTQMDAAAGADKPYMKEADLQGVHDALYIAAFQQFDEIATMGTYFGTTDI
jgi:hypothetical protein